MRRWDAEVDKYVKWCESQGLAASTVMQRRRELEKLGIWLKRRRPKVKLEEADSELLIKYIRSRTAFHAKCTVCGVVSILRAMGEHLVREGLWQKNPMRWIRGPKLGTYMRVPKRIGKAQMSRIWELADGTAGEYRRHLLLCVLAILYGTGLRRGELERLDLTDWQRENGILKIDGRKTGQERHVPISPGVWRCVEAYLPYRHNMLEKHGRLDEKALFINHRGNRYRGVDLSRSIHKLAEQAGVALVTLHQFRHTCASDLLEGGVSLPDVQKILGHAVIGSTVRYTHIADPERARAMQSHPINDFLKEDGQAGRKVS